MGVTNEIVDVIAKSMTTLRDRIELQAFAEFKNGTEVSNILRLYGCVYNKLEENIQFLNIMCKKLESSEKDTPERLTEIFDQITERASAAIGYTDETVIEIEKINQAIEGILNIVEDARKELNLKG